jgi:predicted AAA+ superfamily ATPase
MGHLIRYLNEGGLPDTVDPDLATRQRILRDHPDVVLFRDVVERNGITNLPLVRSLMRTLLASAGRSVSLHELYNDLQGHGRPQNVHARHRTVDGASEDLGQRFESLAFLDLCRQGAEVSYYQTRDRREVDFLATHLDGHRERVQACWDASDPETRAREQTALDEACAETGLGGRIVTPAGWLDEVSRRVSPEAGAAATRLQ